MAPHARSVRDLGQRGHAAADARCNGDPVLGALDGAVPDGDRARVRTARRGARELGRARLLLARTQSVVGRAGGSRPRSGAAHGRRAAHGSRHRAVHRGCDRLDRIRRARAARRRQRRARAGASVRRRARHQVIRGTEGAVGPRRCTDDRTAHHRGAWRSQPRAHGARRNGVYADLAALPPVSARHALQRRANGTSGRVSGGRQTQGRT